MPARDDNLPSLTNEKEGEGRRSIFRQRSVKNYLEGREGEVLPQFVSPRSFFFLWMAFVVLLVSAAIGAYFAHIPLYDSGPAVVVKGEGDDSAVAVFLPPKYLEELQRGDKVRLQSSQEERGARSFSVISVADQVLNPKEARERFDLSDTEAKAIEGPVAVAIAPLEGDAPRQAGGLYRAKVEVGSQRAISLIPVIGEWISGREG